MAGQTVEAVQARRAIGGDTDWELYELIDERPRLSIYELAKLKGWTHGRVHVAVKRLEKNGLVMVELVVDGSRVKSLVRPFEWWEMMTSDELEKFKQMDIPQLGI
jgi:predicted transcriptional regulator